jgi:hypothetical protein
MLGWLDAAPDSLLEPALAARSPPSGTRRRVPFDMIAAGHVHLFESAVVSVDGKLRKAIAKTTCDNEARCYRELMADPALRPFIPELLSTALVSDGDTAGGADACGRVSQLSAPADTQLPGRSQRASDVVELAVTIEDVTAPCTSPCVMDIKLGTRISAAVARVRALPTVRQALRRDMLGAKGGETTPPPFHSGLALLRAPASHSPRHFPRVPVPAHPHAPLPSPTLLPSRQALARFSRARASARARASTCCRSCSSSRPSSRRRRSWREGSPSCGTCG